MRDPSHTEHIKRWAEFVRENPTKWKKLHTVFINAQYQKAREFFAAMRKEPGGEEKVRKILELRRHEDSAV